MARAIPVSKNTVDLATKSRQDSCGPVAELAWLTTNNNDCGKFLASGKRTVRIVLLSLGVMKTRIDVAGNSRKVAAKSLSFLIVKALQTIEILPECSFSRFSRSIRVVVWLEETLACRGNVEPDRNDPEVLTKDVRILSVIWICLGKLWRYCHFLERPKVVLATKQFDGNKTEQNEASGISAMHRHRRSARRSSRTRSVATSNTDRVLD